MVSSDDYNDGYNAGYKAGLSTKSARVRNYAAEQIEEAVNSVPDSNEQGDWGDGFNQGRDTTKKLMLVYAAKVRAKEN